VNDLQSLIARVEKATGPDREIDATVAELTGLKVKRSDKARGRDRLPSWDWTVGGTDEYPIYLEDYTCSLDVVVALVERELPKANIELWSNKPHSGPSDENWGATILILCAPDKDAVAQGKTPALALLLAFLRAKEAQGK
jgi:hypothetical protein